MEKLKLYRIKLDYIRYLWERVDKRVQYREGYPNEYNENRPYIGVVYELNSIKYFAPLEHPRSSHKNLKANPHIIKIESGKYGIIALGNMIPILDECIIEFDINKEEEKYKNILLRQFIFCRKNYTNIMINAKQTYKKVTVEKVPFFIENCCDFKKLESEYKKYIDLNNNKH